MKETWKNGVERKVGETMHPAQLDEKRKGDSPP
jgi:hypothetical protein